LQSHGHNLSLQHIFWTNHWINDSIGHFDILQKDEISKKTRSSPDLELQPQFMMVVVNRGGMIDRQSQQEEIIRIDEQG
jgi:hypothetical protein